MLQITDGAGVPAYASAAESWTGRAAGAEAPSAVPEAPLQRPRTEPVRTEQASSAERGWHGYLRDLGVSAGIFSISGAAAGQGRQAYIVGFDDARTDPDLTRWLIRFGECVWRESGSEALWPFRVSEIQSSAAQPDDGAFLLATQAAKAERAQSLKGFDHAAVLRVSEAGASLAAVLFRSKDAGPFSPACFRSLENILPLVLQSAAARAAVKGKERLVSQLEAVLDRVSLATLLVDMDCRPVFCNEAARNLMQQGAWILKAADGSINCAKSGESKKLKDAVRAVAVQGERGALDTVIRLDGPDGAWRLAFVVPATSRHPDETARCAMIVIHAPTTLQASPHLLEALGLLPSERRFLTSFLKASSLSEAASESGLSPETARTYLKRVRAKLGVHRQMDLASLISGLVPPLRQPQPAAVK